MLNNTPDTFHHNHMTHLKYSVSHIYQQQCHICQIRHCPRTDSCSRRIHNSSRPNLNQSEALRVFIPKAIRAKFCIVKQRHSTNILRRPESDAIPMNPARARKRGILLAFQWLTRQCVSDVSHQNTVVHSTTRSQPRKCIEVS